MGPDSAERSARVAALAVIRELVHFPRVDAASSFVVVFYPGQSPASLDDERRLLKWAAPSHDLPASSVVVAASMRPEAAARPLAVSLNSVAEDSGCFVVADPEGRLGAALDAPTAETSTGRVYAPSTIALLDGAALEVWHPVDPALDAEIFFTWLEAGEARRPQSSSCRARPRRRSHSQCNAGGNRQ